MKKVNTRFKSFTMLAGLIFSSAFLFAQTFLNTTSVFADPTPTTSESTENNQTTENPTTKNNNTENNTQNTGAETTENQGTGNQGNENTNSQTPPANQNGNTENTTEGNSSENHEPATCTSQIGAIGWLICPTTGLLAKGIDALYGLIQGLLDVKPLEMKGDSPIYQVWSYMRNIANICFIIFLLVIIYSQITGYGINNYGVKKSLPRLIVTAMVVNFSFLFCAIAVDISNILGNGLKDLLAGIAESAISSGTVDGFIHYSTLLPLVVLASHLASPFQVAHSAFFSPSSHSLSVVSFLLLLASSFLACVKLSLFFLSPSHLSPSFYTSFQTLKNTSKNGKKPSVRCFSSIRCLACSSVFPNSLVWFLLLPPPLHLD